MVFKPDFDFGGLCKINFVGHIGEEVVLKPNLIKGSHNPLRSGEFLEIGCVAYSNWFFMVSGSFNLQGLGSAILLLQR